jgi:hypothetical protein
MTETTRTEFRVAYDVRAFGEEVGTYEIPLADPTSIEEAASRLAGATGYQSRNVRIQKRTVTVTDWSDVDD